MATWTMYYLENGGVLYRGFGHAHPTIEWNPELRTWVQSGLRLPLGEPIAVRLTEAETERSYPGSTTSPYPPEMTVEREVTFNEMVEYRPEKFDDDLRFSLRGTPEEEQSAAVRAAATRPEWVTKAIDQRQKRTTTSQQGELSDPTARGQA